MVIFVSRVASAKPNVCHGIFSIGAGYDLAVLCPLQQIRATATGGLVHLKGADITEAYCPTKDKVDVLFCMYGNNS
jgi:hypothetical protein